VILTNFINQDFANYHNGLFDQADKIIKLLIVFTTSISPVLLTSNSKSFATLDLKSINNGIFYSLKMVLFISYPLFFGLLTISSSFIPIYLGEDFLDVVPLVKILSPLIFIIGLSNVTTIQIILASKSDKIFTIIVLIASLFSFISSIILIPIFYSIGAALSILLTEILIVIISGIYVYRKFNINIIVSLIRNYKYLLASILMYIVLYYFKFLLNFNNLVSISIIISLGAIIYLSLLIILKDSLLISIIKNEINKIKSLI
jgi:O-antigen/teichoic acid export membrane protein